MDKNFVLAVLFTLIQLSWTRTIPHAHRHCPENSYVAGVSVSKNSDGRIESVRFYCTRPNVLSEFSKSGFIQYEIEPSDPEVEKNWSEPWFCKRGIAVGIQGNSNQVDTMADNEKIQLICSDSSVPEIVDQDTVAWSDFVKCSAGQAFCGVHEGTSGVISSESAKCCDIPHPATTCKTSDIWRVVNECVNEDTTTTSPKTCEYKAVHGISYAGKDAERSVYEGLGFTLESAAPILANKPEFQLKTVDFDYSSMSDVTWALETSNAETTTAEPGYKTKVLQVIGYCGFYKVSTPFFKTETGELTKELHHRAHKHHQSSAELQAHHEKKHSDKYDDTEGMQADSADSWEDSEEEDTPKMEDPKETVPLAGESDKSAVKEGSDEWSDEEEDTKPEVAKVPVHEPNKADSEEWSEEEEDTKPEVAKIPVDEPKKAESDEWSDEEDTKPEMAKIPVHEPKKADSEDWSEEEDTKPEVAKIPVDELKKADSEEWSDEEDTKLEPVELPVHEHKKAESDAKPEVSDVAAAEPKTANSAEWSDEEDTKPEAPKVTEAVADAKKEDSGKWNTSAEETNPVPETEPKIDAQLTESKSVAATLAEAQPAQDEASDEWDDSTEEVVAIPAVVPESKVAEAAPVPEDKAEDKAAATKVSNESDEWGDSSEAEPAPAPVPAAETHADLKKSDDTHKDHSDEWDDSAEEPQEPIPLVQAPTAKKADEDIWDEVEEEPQHPIDTESQAHQTEDSSEVEIIAPEPHHRHIEKLQMAPNHHNENDDSEMAKDEAKDSWEEEDEEADTKSVPALAAPAPVPAPVKDSLFSDEDQDMDSMEDTAPVAAAPIAAAAAPVPALNAWSDEDADSMESDEKLDVSSSNVQPVEEIRVPILSSDSSKQTFGKLQEAPKTNDDQTYGFDVNALTDKVKDMADKVQAGASDVEDQLHDQLQTGGKEFIDEAKKVMQEVKDMPIVQDLGKDIQEGLKNSMDSVRGVDLSPKKADITNEAPAEAQSASDAAGSNAEEDSPRVAKAGGYIGYIVGGMVVCVIVVVIAIFVIEKRQNPTPEPKVNKREYAEVPAPEPLLAGTSRDRKITIETDKDDA